MAGRWLPRPGHGRAPRDPLRHHLEAGTHDDTSEDKGSANVTKRGKEYGTCVSCNTEINAAVDTCSECGGAVRPVAVRVNKSTKLSKVRADQVSPHPLTPPPSAPKGDGGQPKAL